MKKLTLIMTVLVSLSSYSCHKTENSKTAEPEIDYSTVDIGKPIKVTKPTELTNTEKGKGNWGDVPMTSHPTISKDEASQMVDYILSLKK